MGRRKKNDPFKGLGKMSRSVYALIAGSPGKWWTAREVNVIYPEYHHGNIVRTFYNLHNRGLVELKMEAGVIHVKLREISLDVLDEFEWYKLSEGKLIALDEGLILLDKFKSQRIELSPDELEELKQYICVGDVECRRRKRRKKKSKE